MTKAQDAAQWMWDELQRTGTLSQQQAARHLAMRMGTGLAHRNSKGGVSISITVLQNFRRLHGGRARWYRAPDNCWRLEGQECGRSGLTRPAGRPSRASR